MNFMKLNAVPKLGISELREELDDLPYLHSELKEQFPAPLGELDVKKTGAVTNGANISNKSTI